MKPKPAHAEPPPSASDAEKLQQEQSRQSAQDPSKPATAAEQAVEKLRADLQAARDRELRCHAELDNYRKRAARELDEKLRYANMPLLQDLLPVLDNVDRAIQAAEQNADAASLLDGFRMVQQQMEEALKRHNCRQIDAIHQPFDPHVHHAVMQQPSDEYPANTVLTVTQNGYQLHDRVVRPSQVIVSAAKGQ